MKRRVFLKGIGGAALAVPFLSSLAEQESKAQSAGTPPKRLVIFFTHNGCNTNKWFPTVEDGPITAADLSPTLKPLENVVDKLLIPRGAAAIERDSN